MPKMPQWVSITNDHALSSRVRGNSQARFRISGRRSDPLTDCTYSRIDEAFAKRLYADLQSHNIRCWFDLEDLKIGEKFRHRIDESIRVYDKLLLVLSEASLASTWVSYEVEKALNKEPEGVPNVLFPIRLDKAILTCETDWAKDIRKSRHIRDFEYWKDHDAYQVAFERLLRDLKAQS